MKIKCPLDACYSYFPHTRPIYPLINKFVYQMDGFKNVCVHTSVSGLHRIQAMQNIVNSVYLKIAKIQQHFRIIFVVFSFSLVVSHYYRYHPVLATGNDILQGRRRHHIIIVNIVGILLSIILHPLACFQQISSVKVNLLVSNNSLWVCRKLFQFVQNEEIHGQVSPVRQNARH